MAALTTAQRAEILVYDADGNQLPIVPFSVLAESGGEFVDWSPIYGNGQLDVIGKAAGTTVVRATFGDSTGTLEITVTEVQPGELVVTLGPVRPK